MKVLGITGGVGSGKSLVLLHLKQQEGIIVYEADQIAKEEQKQGTRCYELIVEEFGTEILADTGELDRVKLGNIVFANEELLLKLNQIVHPCVREHVLELIEVHKNNGAKIFVIEAAILLESNYQEFCDEVWYIYCEQNKRIERLKASRNYTDDTFKKISDSQLSEEVFRSKCNRVIDNSYDEIHLYQSLDDKIKEFLGEKHEVM